MIPGIRGYHLLVFALFLTPLGAEAQEARACSYDACALRIDGVRLLEGIDGEPVGRIGSFYGDLRILEGGPESASRSTAAFRRRSRAGLWLTLGSGLLLGGAAAAGPSGFDAFSEAPSLALLGGSLVLSRLAAGQFRGAQTELAQAIWHYNQGAAAGMVRPNPDALPLRPSHYGHIGAVFGGAAGIALGLLATSDLGWEDAAKGFSITAGAGLAGGAIGWSIGTRRIRR